MKIKLKKIIFCIRCVLVSLFIFSCSSGQLEDPLKLNQDKLNSNKSGSPLKLKSVSISGDYNLTQKYTYGKSNLIQVDILDYGKNRLNPNPIQITKIKLEYDTSNSLNTMTLYDINVKTHAETSIEQYVWKKQNLIYYNLFERNQDYYGKYNFKFYSGENGNKIKKTKYFQSNDFKDSISREYLYDTLNNEMILSEMVEQKKTTTFNQKSLFTSSRSFCNPFESLPFYIIPILTDFNIGYEPDAGTISPFYGLNQIINQSSVYPQLQIFNVYYGKTSPPFIGDTIVKQIDGFHTISGIDYPTSMKIVHTGLNFNSEHPNHSYFVNFEYNTPSSSMLRTR